MAKLAYPTSTDLYNFLIGSGSSAASLAIQDLVTAIAVGIRDVEERTERQFLASATQTTLIYDPPTNRLQRLAVRDIASVDASGNPLNVSVIYTPSGGVPQTFVQNSQYWMKPYNAPNLGKPWTSIIFPTYFPYSRWLAPVGTSLLRSMHITANWGYAIPTVGFPEDAWQAMVYAGAVALFSVSLDPGDGELIPAFVSGWHASSGTSESYDPKWLLEQRKNWQMQVDEAVTRYRRPSTGMVRE